MFAELLEPAVPKCQGSLIGKAYSRMLSYYWEQPAGFKGVENPGKNHESGSELSAAHSMAKPSALFTDSRLAQVLESQRLHNPARLWQQGIGWRVMGIMLFGMDRPGSCS